MFRLINKYFYFSNGDMISVTCYDYSKEHGSQDHLNLNLQTKEFGEWLYKTPPTCKEGNGNQCVANNPERLNGSTYYLI